MTDNASPALVFEALAKEQNETWEDADPSSMWNDSGLWSANSTPSDVITSEILLNWNQVSSVTPHVRDKEYDFGPTAKSNISFGSGENSTTRIITTSVEEIAKGLEDAGVKVVRFNGGGIKPA